MPQNENLIPHCQCSRSCKNPVEPNSPFCSEHQSKCPRSAPLSGFEPPYEPDRWNVDRAIRETHNCFAYAFNLIDPKQIQECRKDPACNRPFHQPGSYSGYPKFNNREPKTCPNMIARLMGDNPTMKPSSFEKRCPSGTSKIALIVDADEDYHFLRQDSNGFFSQKSGALPVTNKDSLGHPIFDVELANHNWSKRGDTLNYDIFCGYFCIPRDRPLYLRVGGQRGGRLLEIPPTR